jgi:hypothetical protein
MSTRNLAILIAVVLAGCGQTPFKPPLAAVTCDKPKCHVEVSATINGDGSCTLSAPDLYLSGSKKARIVWNLPDSSFKFCTSAGDGAFPKNVDQDQFNNGAATDDDDGNDDPHPARCKKHYRLDDANSASTSMVLYPYSIRFQHFLPGGATVPCTYDPQIRNG